MEFILAILAIAYVLGLPGAVIYLLVANGGLARRIAALEAGSPGAEPGPTRRAEADRLAPLPQDKPFRPIPEAATPSARTRSESPEEPPEEQPPQAADATSPDYMPPPVFVFRQERVDAVGAWLKENWFLAVAAVSLALAGIFFVQYGIETGLLTPPMRVIGALALGAALIAGGEWLRRRGGDEAGDATAFLPSTFAGAGLVSIFAGILAARQLYGLIGAEVAFGGLALTGAGALLLGWFYGPFLSCVGLLGATATPFIIGGDAEDPYWLYGYFALVVVVGLAIDAARRWAWVSTLALVLGFAAAGLLSLSAGGGAWHMAFAIVAAAASAAVPVWRMTPDQGGVTVSESLWRLFTGRDRAWPDFPARLAAGAMLAACGVALWVMDDGVVEFWLAMAGLGLMFLAAAVWLRRAEGLADLWAVPVAAFWAALAMAAWNGNPVFLDFAGWVAPDPEAGPPATVSLLSAGALAASFVAGWRAAAGGRFATAFAFGAALAGPAALILLETFWNPRAMIGPFPWALHALVAAALTTFVAGRHGRAAGAAALGTAVLAMAAMTMIALGAVIVFSKAALTVALAVMVLVSALLDRRFDLPQLGVFTVLGVLVTGWRLVIDPGLPWAEDAPIAEVLLSHGGAVALFAAALWAVRARPRPRQEIYLESGLWGAAGLLVSLLVYRAVDAWGPGSATESDWFLSLQGTVWMIVALGQLYRLRAGGVLNWLRVVLAALAGLLALFAFGLTATLMHPVWGFLPDPVRGPWLLNSLFVAYALPGILLILAAARLGHLPRWLILGLRVLGIASIAHYAALAIRHIWRGPDLDLPGVTDPELYSYTLALLLTSAALMALAFVRRSNALRRIAVIGVGLTIAKVFLIDMSGLTGLIRVVSFLGLGLSLAGLALVNRWVSAALRDEDPEDPAPPSA